MDILIDWQAWETDFGDAKVAMEIRPLKTGAMMVMMPFINVNPEDQVAMMANSMEIHLLAANIFPEHVRNISGVTVNGKPLTPETIADESIFANLTANIIVRLIEISTISRSAEKNSAGPSVLPPSEKGPDGE